MKFIFLISILFLSVTTSIGQETLTVKYFGLAVHPLGDSSADLQPWKLDKEAKFVLNAGLFVGYEKFFYKNIFSVKAIQGITTDCSRGLASISHIGVRILLMDAKKHRVYFGIGPALIVRQSWSRFGEAYKASGFFNEYESDNFGPLQWKLIPYGMEFEYDYCFSETNQLSVSITPGFPATTFSIGWKHWFNLKEVERYKVFKPRRK